MLQFIAEGAVISVQSRIFGFFHNMNSVGFDFKADFFADRLVIGRLDHPFEAADINNYFKMNALERNGSNRSAEHTLFDGNNINVLGSYDNINGLTDAEALVKTLELCAGEGALEVLKHLAVKNITLADKVGNESVLRLIINVLRSADLLDNAAVHNNDRIRH